MITQVLLGGFCKKSVLKNSLQIYCVLDSTGGVFHCIFSIFFRTANLQNTCEQLFVVVDIKSVLRAMSNI